VGVGTGVDSAATIGEALKSWRKSAELPFTWLCAGGVMTPGAMPASNFAGDAGAVLGWGLLTENTGVVRPRVELRRGAAIGTAATLRLAKLWIIQYLHTT
jgi:hypothetical protein